MGRSRLSTGGTESPVAVYMTALLLFGGCGGAGNGVVIGGNHAPTANAQSVTVDEDTNLAVTLTGSDPDAADTLQFTIVTGPATGTLSGTAPNVTYTPDRDFAGSDVFTFKVNDGTADSGTATISITVTDVYAWTNISPYGGFVSSVAFHPGHAGEIWLSGDDSSGIYRSTDNGATWTLLNTPPDQATYSLRFDPLDPSIVYAPNHFGRGLLMTSDSGASWEMRGSSLPMTDPGKRVYDLAVDPANPSNLYICLDGGLFASTDRGLTFNRITSAAFNTDLDFRAVVVSNNPTSRVVAGSASGRVYTSIDDGASWTEVTDTASLPVSDLALTDNALYIAYDNGSITRTTTFNQGDLVLLNDGSGSGVIESGMWTKIAVVSGDTAASDRLFVGSVTNGTTKWGFFASFDGGATFTQRNTSLEGTSVFDLAVDPFDPDHIVYTTINGGGVYVTSDAGLTWARSNTGVTATDSFAFAENPSDAENLLMSSTAGLAGTSKVYETSNGGASWTEVVALGTHDVMSLSFVSGDPGSILAGTFGDGIYRAGTGSGGQWTQVLAAAVRIPRIRRDAVAPMTLYAVTDPFTPAANPADDGIYVSVNGGASWVQRSTIPQFDVEPHPANENESVAVGADATVTTDGFATAPISLGLAAAAPGSIFTSAGFDPDNPATLLVGTLTGELYRTTDYSPSGGATWSQVATPARSVAFIDIVVAAGTWYVACWTGDTQVRPDSTPGILRSNDGGATWTFLDAGLFPSRLVWRLAASPAIASRYYVGMWGGGFMRLDD